MFLDCLVQSPLGATAVGRHDAQRHEVHELASYVIFDVTYQSEDIVQLI